MYKMLDKDTIEIEIVPYIPNGKRGFAPTVPLVEIINSILYKLKTGVQWEYLPVSSLFSDKTLTWQGVYYHFNNWNKSGTFKQCWISFLIQFSFNIFVYLLNGKTYIISGKRIAESFTGLN